MCDIEERNKPCLDYIQMPSFRTRGNDLIDRYKLNIIKHHFILNVNLCTCIFICKENGL